MNLRSIPRLLWCVPFDPASAFGAASSPEKVQRVLDSLRYRRPGFYGVQSARCSLESGEAHCLEGALVAAFLMERLGHPPRILGLYGVPSGRIRDNAHAVYIYTSPDGYCSLGKSQYPELEARHEPFPTVDALAQSYRHGLAARGVDLEYWTIVNPDFLRRFDRALIERNWRAGTGNLSAITYALMLGRRFYIMPNGANGNGQSHS